MSSRKTEHYQLNQWVEDDLVLRESFNADNLAIDTALAKLADGKMDATAGQTALANHTNSKSNPHGVTAAQAGAAATSHSHAATNITSGTLAIARGGTGNTTGLAASATKLATARTVRTNLASTGTASFNGTVNIAPGVTGTLPVANGGTGLTTLTALATALNVPTIVTGTYTGDKAESRTIHLGFTPTAVLLFADTGATKGTTEYYGGLALPDYPAQCYYGPTITVVSGGFTVYCYQKGNTSVWTNQINNVYYYIAFQ